MVRFLGGIDGVALSALSGGLVLATRNVRDFVGCGVALFDPFA